MWLRIVQWPDSREQENAPLESIEGGGISRPVNAISLSKDYMTAHTHVGRIINILKTQWCCDVPIQRRGPESYSGCENTDTNTSNILNCSHFIRNTFYRCSDMSPNKLS